MYFYVCQISILFVFYCGENFHELSRRVPCLLNSQFHRSSELPSHHRLELLAQHPHRIQVSKTPLLQPTSVKLVSELGEITFSTGKPKLTPGEVQGF